jgi:biotin carboxyl carrier protein
VPHKKPFQTRIKTADGKWLSVSITERSDRRLEVAVDGETFQVRPQDIAGAAHGDGPGPAAAALQAAPDKLVRAPMPGVVTRLAVRPGDAVTAQQPLLVLLAMKMENEILSSSAGRIKHVFVADRQTVQTGDPLVELD